MSTLPVKRHSLVESTILAIRDQIARQAWAVGERIPSEAELADLFGVGRNTVREAIRVLSHTQMLEVRQGDGTYLRSEVDPIETVRSLANASLLDHLEMQLMLEVEAARFAARRAQDEDVALLRRLLLERGEHRRGQDDADFDAFLQRDGRFHMAVAAASHNEAIQVLYGHFLLSVRRHARQLLEHEELPEPDLASHRAIVDAIAAHDEQKAADAARDLLQPLIERLHRHGLPRRPGG